MKEIFQEKCNILRLFFFLLNRRSGKLSLVISLFFVLLEEAPNLTFINIRMMSRVISNAISQTKMKKREKAITARLLTVSSVQEDLHNSKHSQN